MALIVLALGATLINDIGAVVSTHYRAQDEADRIARAAQAQYALYESAEKALAAAQSAANQDGVTLTGFDVTRSEVRVGIQMPPRTTWVAQRIDPLKTYLSATAQSSIPLR